MAESDLLSMFGLSDKAGATVADDFSTVEGGEPANVVQVSDTALKLDNWSIRRGEDVLAESERLQQQKLESLAVADFVGAAFEFEPELVERCSDDLRHGYVKQLLDTAEYKTIHASTAGNLLTSEIAAHHFAQGFAALRTELEKKEKCRKPEKKGDKPSDKADEEFENEVAMIRAAGNALKAAKEECDEAIQCANAFGLGGDGANPASMNSTAVAKLFKKVRDNETLRKIIENQGRYQRLASALQRRKVTHGMDDVVGVTLGDEIGRLVPAELNNFAIPGLDLDLLRRLTEQQAVVRDHRGVEKVAKGPFVLVIDESGSMRGTKIEQAKGIALTFAWLARQQNRWCALVAFSGGATGRLLALPPGKWDEAALLGWITNFLGGGTVCDAPLVELPNAYWPAFVEQGMQRGKTDVVIITDGIVDVPEAVAANFNAWKTSEQAKVTTLIIGASEAGDLATVSDRVHIVRSLGVNEEAVSEILSI